jgi:ethanolamine utilization protein EutN
MQLGRVIGQATSTVKHPSMQGWRLLVIQPLMDDETADGDPIVSIDNLGAGRNDLVIITSDGLSVREMLKSDNTPVRWAVLGLKDS